VWGRTWWRVGAFGVCAAALAVAGTANVAFANIRHESRSHAAASGTLTVAVATAVTTLSPQPFNPADSYFERAVYEPLIDLNGNTPVGILATSWRFGHADRSLTIELRKNVRYSDGTPFTATDAAWNINWVKQKSTGAQAVALWQNVTPKVLGRYSLRLDFTRPMPDIFGMLAASLIVKPNSQQNGIGTGPFRVQSFVPGTSLTLVRNPRYWAKGEPKLQSIVFKNYPDLTTAALALQSHAADVLFNASFTQIGSLRSAGFKYLEIPGGGADDILINTAQAPLNNPKVREALSLAFDRKAFVKIAAQGYETPTCSIFPVSSPAYSQANNQCTFSLAKAKKLLHEAGVSNLTLSINAASILPQTTFLPIYKQDLASIGVTLNINVIDTATWIQESATGAFPQLLAHIYNFGNSDPALLFSAYPFRPTGNAEHFNSSQYQYMVAHASIAGNPKNRIAQYQKIDKFVQQQAFVIPLASDTTPVLYSPKVRGLKVADGIVLNYNNASIGS
jgi:peptide/nickel transport system substrate-binding protein